MGIAEEADLTGRAFYEAWLAEENGDFEEAIRGFRSPRDAAASGPPPGERPSGSP
jgi:hypothetical protein